MPKLTLSEQKIADLCRKVVALNDPDELRLAAVELKAAIHDHLTDAKDNLVILARRIAVANERSKAAD